MDGGRAWGVSKEGVCSGFRILSDRINMCEQMARGTEGIRGGGGNRRERGGKIELICLRGNRELFFSKACLGNWV